MEEFSWDPSVYRDKWGRIIQADELELLLRNNDYCIIKQEIVGPYFISTVWLGIPCYTNAYYETIVFEIPEGVKDPRESSGESLDLYRYRTLEEAENGHEEVIKEWREKL